jgi:hypothetical protein
MDIRKSTSGVSVNSWPEKQETLNLTSEFCILPLLVLTGELGQFVGFFVQIIGESSLFFSA